MDKKYYFVIGAVVLGGIWWFTRKPSVTAIPPGSTTGGWTNTTGAPAYLNAAGQILSSAGTLIKTLTSGGNTSGGGNTPYYTQGLNPLNQGDYNANLQPQTSSGATAENTGSATVDTGGDDTSWFVG